MASSKLAPESWHNNTMHAKPDLRVLLKWMIFRSGSVIVAVISNRIRCDKLISILTNSRPNWIFKIAWILLAISYMTVLPVLVPRAFDLNRNDSFYTWPSNQFWEICLLGIVAAAIVMAFRFNWGPILPTTVFVAFFPCLGDTELLQLITGLFVGIVLDILTIGVPDLRSGLKFDEITNG